MATDIAHQDSWGAANPNEALLNPSPAPMHGGGMQGTNPGPAKPRDYSAAFRAMGFAPGDGPTGEQAGQHKVQAPGGRAMRGSDVPAEGVAAPEAAGAGEAAAGAGEAAGAAGIGAEVAELAPLAIAAL